METLILLHTTMYMHSALRDKMPNVSSLICIQPLKKRVGFKEIRTNLRGKKKLLRLYEILFFS